MSFAIALSIALSAGTQIEAVDVSAAAPPPVDIGVKSAYRVVAMMPLSSLGSTDDVSEAIERVLVGEMKQLLGDRLVTPDKLLERGADASGAFMECEGVVVCLVEVVGGLGWDAFVVGNIAGLGDARVINLKLIDVRTGGEVRRARTATSGEENEMISQMRKAAVTLLAPELLVGTVDLQIAQPDIKILVDGQVVGTTPLKNSRVQLPVGPHAVEASGEGRVPFSTLVDLSYGEIKTVEIVLPDNTVYVGGSTPFRARWWTWTVLGGGVVSAGLGGFFNALQADTVSKINARAEAGTLTIEHRDLFRQEQEQWITAVVFYAVGGALVGTVAVLLGIDLVSL
jgi:hypothetical protein